MRSLILIWKKIPLIVRAVLTGLIVATVGTTPWAILVSLNLKYSPAIPWAVPLTAVYLWLYWRYLQGAGWPRSTAAFRKTNCRANPLPDEAWGPALRAGISGLVFIVLFQAVLSRIVRLPAQPIQDISRVPTLTLFFILPMSAVVAGVAEEAAFRGYMQGPIEKRHGPIIAILVVGIFFGFAHFSHPEVSFIILPYYLIVSAVYGMLAYYTNLIFPSMLLHAGGNMLSAVGFIMAGNTVSQSPSKQIPLIWESGADAKFCIICGAALLIGVFTVIAYKKLAAVCKKINL